MSSNSVTLTSGSSTSATVTVNSAITIGSTHFGWGVGGGGALLAGIFLVFVPRRRRTLPRICCLLTLTFLAGVLGCSGPQSATPTVFKANAGTYTVLVTGTSSSGAVHDATVTVIVQ
jgi:hypothetical protein